MTPSTLDFPDRATTRAAVADLTKRLDETLKGKPQVIRNVLACLLARGHLLLEDRPGLGKTTLAKALTESLGGGFARIQCTPDLLPSDITGFNIFDQKSREFAFREGPVFSDVLLADEINRATPRTQSALLEAMAERQVTVDARCFPLAESFFVIATQNPHEQHGTYPLPEAQLDRFSMKLEIGYPSPEHECRMLQAAIDESVGRRERRFEPILDRAALGRLQATVASIGVTRIVQRYLVDLATASRRHDDIMLGCSPRGLLVWQRVAQAWAWLDGRDFVTPDDVQAVAVPVLSVRLAVASGDATAVIDDLLAQVEVPVS